MKKQFSGLLYDSGFIYSPDPLHPEVNYNSDNVKLVKAVLCAGLYPNVAKIEQTRPDRSARNTLQHPTAVKNIYKYYCIIEGDEKQSC